MEEELCVHCSETVKIARKVYLKVLSPNSAELSNHELVARVCLGYLGVNSVGLVLAHFWGMPRAVFNLDYLLAGLVYVWMSRSLAAVLAVTFFVMDVVTILIPVFFLSREAFSLQFWLRSVQQWPNGVKGVALMGATVMLLIMIGVFRRYRLSNLNRVMATISIFVMGGLLVAADFWNGSSNEFSSQANHFDVNIAGSPAHYIIYVTKQSLYGKKAELVPISPGASAVGRYFLDLLASSPTRDQLTNGMAGLPSILGEGDLPEKLVVVVVESLSVLKEDTSLEAWRRPFNSLANRYAVQSGILDWRGATLRGELRELCWQSMDGYQIETLPASLPSVLKNMQYETCAFHGYHSAMYQRYRLYPLLGFERSFFVDDMEMGGCNHVPIAGTLFPGATDNYVASLVREEVLKPGKRLVYWMTLSGHIPVNISLARDLAAHETQETSRKLPVEVWAHTVICRNVLERIAEIAAQKSLSNCDFVIVGDHSVPFTDAKLRGFYQPNRVPYLILRHNKSVSEGAMAAEAL